MLLGGLEISFTEGVGGLLDYLVPLLDVHIPLLDLNQDLFGFINGVPNEIDQLLLPERSDLLLNTGALVKGDLVIPCFEGCFSLAKDLLEVLHRKRFWCGNPCMRGLRKWENHSIVHRVGILSTMKNRFPTRIKRP